jgi:serine/threonine protein kinase
MLKWMRQIASGMGYLHSHKIWHRDLKSENVLIDKNKVCKICDYGLSKLMVGGSGSGGTARALSSRAKGTPDYMPPEVLAGAESGMASDVYSYGILLNEMASRQRPWSHVDTVDGRMFVITNMVANLGKRPTIASNLEPAFQSLVEACWAHDPEQRPAFDTDGGGNSANVAEVSIEHVEKICRLPPFAGLEN